MFFNSGCISRMIIRSFPTRRSSDLVRSYAGLFKIDFGQLENEKEILDADGNPTDMLREHVTTRNIKPTCTFTDPNENVATNSASIVGTTNAAGTEVTWKLKDFSTNG